jgi:hypothetical protein
MHLEELKFTADDPTMILLPPSLKKIKFSWYDPTTIEKVINMIKLLPISINQQYRCFKTNERSIKRRI